MNFTMMPSTDWYTLENAFKREYGYKPDFNAFFYGEPNEGYNIFDVDLLEDEDVHEDIVKMWEMIHSFCQYDTILVYMSF